MVKLVSEGKIAPSSQWRDVEKLLDQDSTFASIQEQDRDAPRDIFEECAEEWDHIYRRDYKLLSRLVHPKSGREILVTIGTTYDALVKALLQEADSSPHLASEARSIVKTDEQLSSACLYFNEMLKQARENNAAPLRRRGYGSRRSHGDSSSEDEGEILEDGEEEGEMETTKNDFTAKTMDVTSTQSGDEA